MTTTKFCFFSVMTCLLLTGCVSSGGGGGWPVQTFPYACTGHSIPFEPMCVSSLGGDGFKYRDEFQACRQGVTAYEDAINTFLRCKRDELKTAFDRSIRDVKKTYNCFVDYFSTHKQGDPSGQCDLVEEPTFHARYEADGIEMYFGIPNCVRKSSTTLYIPKRYYELERCKDDVEAFTGSRFGSFSTRATSAQKQYDTFMQNLRRKAETKLDDAVRQFNCKARGERFCI